MPGRALRAATARWTATAARSASNGLANTTISPSPRFFTSCPPDPATAVRNTAKYSRRNSSAASSPKAARWWVESTRSLNMNVTTPVPARAEVRGSFVTAGFPFESSVKRPTGA